MSSGTVKPNLRKTEAIYQWASLTDVKELQEFLGFCNYYGHFVHYFLDIAAPIYVLL